MNQLRDSQVETLRQFDALEGEATAAEIASRLGCSDSNAYQRIVRLVGSRNLSERFSSAWPSKYFYSLTQLGREALEGR